MSQSTALVHYTAQGAKFLEEQAQKREQIAGKLLFNNLNRLFSGNQNQARAVVPYTPQGARFIEGQILRIEQIVADCSECVYGLETPREIVSIVLESGILRGERERSAAPIIAEYCVEILRGSEQGRETAIRVAKIVGKLICNNPNHPLGNLISEYRDPIFYLGDVVFFSKSIGNRMLSDRQRVLADHTPESLALAGYIPTIRFYSPSQSDCICPYKSPLPQWLFGQVVDESNPLFHLTPHRGLPPLSIDDQMQRVPDTYTLPTLDALVQMYVAQNVRLFS